MAGFHKIFSYLLKNFVCQQKLGKTCHYLRLEHVANMEQSLNILIPSSHLLPKLLILKHTNIISSFA